MSHWNPLTTRPKLSYRTKKPITQLYRWNKLMTSLPGEEKKKFTEAELTPLFIKEKGCLSVEDLTLERIRRKFFVDLKEAKDYQRDFYMPKALLLLSLVMKREMIPLTEVSMWLGMPKFYLRNLAKRDPAFRRLIIHWREQNKDMKADRAQGSVMTGQQTILLRIKPENNSANWNIPDVGFKYDHHIDVGWTAKVYSRLL